MASRNDTSGIAEVNLLERSSREGETPVFTLQCAAYRCVFSESSSLGLLLKIGGKLHLKLNIGERPIANKYCEGKMKRTLKRELKVPETAARKANGTSSASRETVFTQLSLAWHRKGHLRWRCGARCNFDAMSASVGVSL